MKTLHNNGERSYLVLDRHQDPPRLVAIPTGGSRQVSDETFERSVKTFKHLAGPPTRPAATRKDGGS